jgi:putative PIN family toxin of toxin-antitoxin system
VSYVVTFDTNILLSDVGWRDCPYQCLEFARADDVESVTCRELLEELSEKPVTKLRFSPVQAIDTIADLLTFMRLVTIPNSLEVVAANPDENKVVECAVVGRSTHIVTGDRRHLLPLGSYQGNDIVTAAEFLALVSAM